MIPVRVELGAIVSDGRGGSSFLHDRALSEPGSLFTLTDEKGGEAARLSELHLRRGENPSDLVGSTLELLNDLRPRRAFYVRLLDRDNDEFDSVEIFFREIVDEVVSTQGYSPHEVGRDDPLAAFMNVEIFQGIHTAGLVVVDLTGVRPNCMMELGYAYGRQRQVILTAKKGTRLPFDSDKLPTYFWDPKTCQTSNIAELDAWFDRYVDTPHLIE